MKFTTSNLSKTRISWYKMALFFGHITLLFSTTVSCGLFASTDGFEVYKGKMPDKSFVENSDKIPLQSFKLGFDKNNYPRPVQIVDDRNLLDKSYMESTFAALAVLSEKFGIDLQTPLLRANDSQAMDILYNTALKRGYRVFLLPSYLHQNIFENYYLKNKKEFEKDENFLFVGVDFRFREGIIKSGSAVSLNFKTEESSFVVGYAAAHYLAEKYSNPEERVVSAFAGAPSQAATDYVFGFLEGIKYWNQTQPKKVKFLGDKVDTTSGFDVASPSAGKSINKSISGGKTKIIFPVSGGKISRRLLSETENNKDTFIIGVDTDMSKSFLEYKDRIFSSSLKNIGTWIYKVLQDYYSGSKEILEEGKNMDLYKGIREGWVGYSKSTIADSEIVDRYLDEAKEILLKILDGKLKSDWKKDFDFYLASTPQLGKENLIPEALARIVKDINTLFKAGKNKKS